MLRCDANQYKISVKAAEAENDRGTIECRGNHREFEVQSSLPGKLSKQKDCCGVCRWTFISFPVNLRVHRWFGLSREQGLWTASLGVQP